MVRWPVPDLLLWRPAPRCSVPDGGEGEGVDWELKFSSCLLFCADIWKESAMGCVRAVISAVLVRGHTVKWLASI